MHLCLNMEELSLLDKKIIYELGKDSRQSYKQIAQKIKSKKEVVAYHINELISKGIISKFVPVFSLSRIGILSHKIYIRLQGLNAEKEKKLIEDLIKDEKVVWIAKSVGRWDLLLGFYAKNIIEFSKVKDNILSKLSKYIADYDLTFIEDAFVLNRDYLIDKKRFQRESFSFAGELKNEKLDNLDLKIIQLIKNDSRKPLLDIANQLDIDARTVKDRIKHLKSKQILQGQTVFLNLNKISFQLHKLCIKLKDYNLQEFNSLINYCKNNPYVIHIIKSLGSWELELEIEDNKLENIYEYIKLLKNDFANLIRQIELVTITNELKLNFFPEKI